MILAGNVDIHTILDDFECPADPMTEYGDITRSRDNDMGPDYTLHVAPTPPPPNPVIDLRHIGKICQKASTEKSLDNIDRQTDDR